MGSSPNRLLQWGGWRLQERPDPQISGYDMPLGIGRRYTIYYNAIQVGRYHPECHFPAMRTIF
jgi:hypothetical protein